jgi:hypothetical protein
MVETKSTLTDEQRATIRGQAAAEPATKPVPNPDFPLPSEDDAEDPA